MFPCYSSNGVFIFVHLRCILLSDCSTSQGSLVSLVCQRSNFVLPLPLSFLPGAISRISGRDPLLVWESCDARRPTSQKIPEDARRFQMFRVARVFQLCLCYLFLHCIMSSCHHVIFIFASQPK